MGEMIPLQRVHDRLRVLRGQRVLLSSDLAELYGVEHRALVQAVKRNGERFPGDFMFRLKPQEWSRLRSQFVILEKRRGGASTSPFVPIAHGRGLHAKYAPLAFTEQGVAMLSSVLRSRRAVQVNIEIMRAFVELRRWLISNREVAKRIDALEKKYDGQLKIVFHAIDALGEPPPSPPRTIGFRR